MALPVPAVPGLPFIGNLFDINPEEPINSFKILCEKYGPIFTFHFFGNEKYVVSNVELLNELCDEKRFCKSVSGALEQVRNGIHDGLFTAYHGEPNWASAHRVLVPAFGPIGIKDMFDEMYDIATQLVAKWARMGPDAQINVTDDFTRLTLDSIALCAMDKRFNSFYQEKMHPFVGAMVGFLTESGARNRRTSIEAFFNRESQRKYEKDIALMQSVAQEVIAHRRANPVDKKDLLNTLLFGKDPKTGERLNDDVIMNNMITFLIAGHETTSGLLSFTSYYLLKNPECIQKAQEEVDRVVGKGPVTFQHMSKLPYIEAILRESLRLSPTAPAFTVKPLPGTKDPVLIAGKYLIPPEMPIVCWLPEVGRDPAVFGADANEYKPERMMGENFSRLPPNAWKPFGNGARGCIGRPFAWQESILVLALLFQNFNLRFDDPSYQLHIKQTLTIKPKDFFMKASLRDGIDPVTLEKKMFAGIPGQSQTVARSKVETGGPGGTAKPLYILYGSNSGTCEGLAQNLAGNASAHGFQATVQPLDAAADRFPLEEPVVIITASYEGNPPDNAGLFVEWLKNVDAQKISNSRTAVFGCGHHDWAATFQKVPKLIETLLKEKGSTLLVPRGETDVAQGIIFDDFDAWQDDLLWPVLSDTKEKGDVDVEGLAMELSTASRASHLRHNVQDAIVVKNELLTKPGPTEKRQVDFKLPTNMTYEAGDYLALLPINNVPTISRVLRRFKLPWDAMMTLKKGAHTTIPTGQPLAVSVVLGAYVELGNVATKKNLTTITKFTTDGATKEAISTTDLSSHSILDILETHESIQLPFPVYLSMLTPMRIRQYSISSSPLTDPTIASITFSLVSSNHTEHPHLGVATTYLAQLSPGTTVKLSIKKSQPAFHLPLDDANTPIIMVASGTGIAPFMGFAAERAAKIAAGRKLAPALLFVGCHSPEIDLLYKDRLEKYAKDGVLSTFHAFSQASEQSSGCKYVQDRLWIERQQVSSLFDQGARAYICGSGRLGRGVADVVAKIYVAKKKEKKGEEVSVEEGLKWWEGLRGERFAVDVFD